MLLKNVKDIDIEDEFIKVSKEEKVLNIAKNLIDLRKERSCDIDNHETICVPVLAAYVLDNDNNDKLVGVIYEEDIIEKIILEKKNPNTLTAKDVMKDPVCCSINTEIREAVNLIIDKGLLTLAVCDGDNLVGVVSVFDAIFLQEEIDDNSS